VKQTAALGDPVVPITVHYRLQAFLERLPSRWKFQTIFVRAQIVAFVRLPGARKSEFTT
jgi:hypothetical protein